MPHSIQQWLVFAWVFCMVFGLLMLPVAGHLVSHAKAGYTHN
jgi:hypothetical protein